jgi:hypothetical protein
MKNIIMSFGALLILASCANEAVETPVEETVVDTTVVVEEEVVTEEVAVEEVEAEGEMAMEE